MAAGLLFRLRAQGPFRHGTGPGSRTELTFRSDALYSAVTLAMRQLGVLEEWVRDTVANPGGPAVVLTSCFPYHGATLYVAPPRSLWPPAPSTRVRWKSARFVPWEVVPSLLAGRPLEEDKWVVDPASDCLLAAEKRGLAEAPFRTATRVGLAVDRRNHGSSLPFTMHCVEFKDGAGLWCAARFPDGQMRNPWPDRLVAAFRLLADTGLGAGRSRGWGRFEIEETRESLPVEIDGTAPPAVAGECAWWLLSLYSPREQDGVNWRRGDYSLAVRGGRVESSANPGEQKKLVRMVEEGSVIFAAGRPVGAAPDVAPEGFPHPVYRSGLAFAVALPPRGQAVPAPPEERRPIAEVSRTIEPAPAPTPAPEPAEPSPAEEPAPTTPEPEPAVPTGSTAEAGIAVESAPEAQPAGPESAVDDAPTPEPVSPEKTTAEPADPESTRDDQPADKTGTAEPEQGIHPPPPDTNEGEPDDGGQS